MSLKIKDYGKKKGKDKETPADKNQGLNAA